MRTVTFIGRKRTGKTTQAVKLIKKIGMPAYIFDVNSEYQKHGIDNRYKGELTKEKFLSAVSNLKNSTIVFEEAASYLSSREADERILSILQRSRHSNNVIILIFHALSDFPSRIYGRIDYIFLFKTLDFSSTLDAKFKKNTQFMHHFEKVKKSSSEHFYSAFQPL